MVGGRAGRGDRVVDALDLEPGGERRRGGRAHRLGHGERADALGPLLARDVGGLDDGAGRGAAGAHDECRCARWRCRSPRGRNPGSPDPWRCGSRPCRRPWKRVARRSTMARRIELWARRAPGSGSRARRIRRRRTMPDLASRRLASTSWRGVADRGDDAHAGDDDAPHVWLPHSAGRTFARRRSADRRLGRALEQADPQVLGLIDGACRRPSASRRRCRAPACERSTRFRSMPYSTSFAVGSTMPENLTSPTDSARPRPGAPSQPRKKPEHLPERVEAEAAGHHRIALEVAGEEPEVGLDVELGADLALAVLAAVLADLGDAVEHQHRRQRQLGVARAEQLAPAAGEQALRSRSSSRSSRSSQAWPVSSVVRHRVRSKPPACRRA